MASMFALYHGANNLRSIAETAHAITTYLEAKLRECSYAIEAGARFDTIKLSVTESQMSQIQSLAKEERINLRYYNDSELGFSIDETVDSSILASLGRFLVLQWILGNRY